jgi:hypothetical protein
VIKCSWITARKKRNFEKRLTVVWNVFCLEVFDSMETPAEIEVTLQVKWRIKKIL